MIKKAKTTRLPRAAEQLISRYPSTTRQWYRAMVRAIIAQTTNPDPEGGEHLQDFIDSRRTRILELHPLLSEDEVNILVGQLVEASATPSAAPKTKTPTLSKRVQAALDQKRTLLLRNRPEAGDSVVKLTAAKMVGVRLSCIENIGVRDRLGLLAEATGVVAQKLIVDPSTGEETADEWLVMRTNDLQYRGTVVNSTAVFQRDSVSNGVERLKPKNEYQLAPQLALDGYALIADFALSKESLNKWMSRWFILIAEGYSSFGVKRSVSNHNVLVERTYVRGLDFGTPIDEATLPENVALIDWGHEHKALVFFRDSGFIAFLGAKSPAAVSRLLRAIHECDVAQEEMVKEFVSQLSDTLKAKLAHAEDRMKKISVELQDTAGTVGRLRLMQRLVEKGGAAVIQGRIDDLRRSGLQNLRLTRRGIVARLDDVTIDVGDNETQANFRYLGSFDAVITLNGGLAITNVASPLSSNVHHPWFASDHACLGAYEDTLRHCVMTDDWYTYGLTILALLTHFSADRIYLTKKYPAKKPENTRVVPGRVVIFGDVPKDAVFRDDDDEDADDSSDDEEDDE